MTEIRILEHVPRPTAGADTRVLLLRAQQLLLAYRMYEDDEYFAVLEFTGVENHSVGPPNDEALEATDCIVRGNRIAASSGDEAIAASLESSA